MISTLLALVDPGDEVIVFEPFYENYGPDTILADARPVYVPLEPGQPARPRPAGRGVLARGPGRSSSTRRAIPRAGCSRRAELGAIAELCVRHDALAVTDEIYEHIRFDGEHIPIATLPGMRERTVTISGASKTFSVTGWRIGWIIAPADLTDAIRKVHDFLTVGAPAPLQEGVAAALDGLPARVLRRARRACTAASATCSHAALVAAGFRCLRPEGAYYILADFTGLRPPRPRASTTRPSPCG